MQPSVHKKQALCTSPTSRSNRQCYHCHPSSMTAKPPVGSARACKANGEIEWHTIAWCAAAANRPRQPHTCFAAGAPVGCVREVVCCAARVGKLCVQRDALRHCHTCDASTRALAQSESWCCQADTYFFTPSKQSQQHSCVPGAAARCARRPHNTETRRQLTQT